MQPASRGHQPALSGVPGGEPPVLDAERPRQSRQVARPVEEAGGSPLAQIPVAMVALDLAARAPLGRVDPQTPAERQVAPQAYRVGLGGQGEGAVAGENGERIAEELGAGDGQLDGVRDGDQAGPPLQLPGQAAQGGWARIGQIGQAQAQQAEFRELAQGQRVPGGEEQTGAAQAGQEFAPTQRGLAACHGATRRTAPH